jgi:hypothetical protein
MKEFFEQYEGLKQYEEFDNEAILEKYRYFEEQDAESGDGEWKTPPWIFEAKLAFEYVLLAYAPDSSLSGIKDLQTRKEKALKDSKIPSDHWKGILGNSNPMVGDMITRLFREIEDFEYELLISGKEAIQTLLEVVRKPIDTRLQDDKERNAVKAKRECFEDAEFMMGKVQAIFNRMNEINVDLAESANKSVFKGGMAERLANAQK